MIIGNRETSLDIDSLKKCIASIKTGSIIEANKKNESKVKGILSIFSVTHERQINIDGVNRFLTW